MELWNEILKILLLVAVAVLEHYVIKAIKAKISANGDDELYSHIADLVAAAEKLFPDAKSGADKLEYVRDQLESVGITYTDAVRAKIEAAVYRLEG